MGRVLAGSEGDKRWCPMSPDKPQTQKPAKKRKKSDIIKEYLNKNSALRHKLNEVIDENIRLAALLKEKDKPKPVPPIVTKPAPETKPIPAESPKPKPETEPKPVKKAVKKVAKSTVRTRRKQ